MEKPTPFIMEHVIANDFTIDYPYNQHLSTYFILSWSVGHIRKQIVDCGITKDGVKYRVVYHRHRKLANLKIGDQCLLSFRAANPKDYPYLLPTVLITPK
jgi:hypothetical protein